MLGQGMMENMLGSGGSEPRLKKLYNVILKIYNLPHHTGVVHLKHHIKGFTDTVTGGGGGEGHCPLFVFTPAP